MAAQGDLSELMFVRIPHNASYTGQRSNFFRGTLSVASGNDDLRRGILTPHAANRRPCILIGDRSNGTRIQDDYVGLRGCGGAGQAALLELAFKGGAIGLRRTATEILHVIAGHRTMVAYAPSLWGNWPHK